MQVDSAIAKNHLLKYFDKEQEIPLNWKLIAECLVPQ